MKDENYSEEYLDLIKIEKKAKIVAEEIEEIEPRPIRSTNSTRNILVYNRLPRCASKIVLKTLNLVKLQRKFEIINYFKAGATVSVLHIY